MQKFEFELFADYFQFYIQDDNEALGDLSDSWSKEATENLIAVSDGVIGIGTARNMDVPVTIEILCKPISLLESDYDKINVATIQCNSGKLVVAGCTDYYPEAARITLAPGKYEAKIGYRSARTGTALLIREKLPYSKIKCIQLTFWSMLRFGVRQNATTTKT